MDQIIKPDLSPLKRIPFSFLKRQALFPMDQQTRLPPAALYLNGFTIQLRPYTRLIYLDVEDCSGELLRQQAYAIKNQLGHPQAPTRLILGSIMVTLISLRTSDTGHLLGALKP